MIRVAVADDQELVRAGFETILAAQSDLLIVGTAADGLEGRTGTALVQVGSVQTRFRPRRLAA
jgi:DNA-binding NarL/FixJ family response regulator